MILPTRPTITEGVRATKSISICSHLLAIAGLDELLRAEGDYTLFAPTDQAFDNLPAGVLGSLQADPAKLRDVLEYHILSVGRELSQLRNGKLVTLQGALITASVTDDGMQIDHASTRGQPMLERHDSPDRRGALPRVHARALRHRHEGFGMVGAPARADYHRCDERDERDKHDERGSERGRGGFRVACGESVQEIGLTARLP